MGKTEFHEKVNYQRALEGELERTIQGCATWRRQGCICDARGFRIHRPATTAKAAVVLKLRRGAISPDAQLSIARLVAGAVDELSPDHVSVIDADTNRPLGVPGDSPSAGSMNEQLTQRLLATRTPVVGAERVRASVNVEYDPSTLEESQERYDPAATVTLSMQRSEEVIGGAGVEGVPGTSSNVPGASAGANPSATTGDITRTRNRIVSPKGSIKLFDAHRSPGQNSPHYSRSAPRRSGGNEAGERQTGGGAQEMTAEELRQIQELGQAALGLDTARGDLISVQNISFDQPATQVLPPSTWMERIRTTVNAWSLLLRYAVIVLLFSPPIDW